MKKEDEDDDLFSRACGFARAEGRASNTFLQERLGIGTGRARKLLARMEAAGVISPADALGARTVFGATKPSTATVFPTETCTAWEDCGHDGICHDPAFCGLVPFRQYARNPPHRFPDKPSPDPAPTPEPEPPSSAAPEAAGDRYDEAVALVRESGEPFGTSFIQRRLGIGYNAAARLTERMEAEGVASRTDGMGKRSVLPHGDRLLQQAVELAKGADRAAKAGDDVAFVALSVGAAQSLELHRVLNPKTATQRGETKMGDVTDDEDDGEGKPKNVQAPGSNLVSGEEVRTFIERVEKVRDEKRKLSDFEKEIFAEMKSRGHDTKAVRYLLKRRTLKPSELEEFEAITELYMAAVGMLREPPLFRAVAGMGVDPNVRESVIAALKMIAPMDGEITIREGSGPRIRIIRDKDGVRAEEVADTPLSPLPGQDHPGRPGAAEVPAVDENGAFLLGKTARKEDVPVVQNPFPFGDPRRRHWDEGWREEDGGDGFGGGDE